MTRTHMPARARGAALLAAAALGVAGLASSTAEAAWSYADIAQHGGQPSAVIWNNAPHTFWVGSGVQLKHSYLSGGWQEEILLTPFDTSLGLSHPTAVAFNGKMYVFHYDANAQSLDYMLGAGTAADAGPWSLESLDGQTATFDQANKSGVTGDAVGPFTATTVYNNRLYVTYVDSTTGVLRVARYNPTQDFWSIFNVDGGAGRYITGRPSMFVYNGVLEIFYYDSTSGDFRGAWSLDGGNTWGSMIMDGEGGSNGQNFGRPGYYSAVTLWNSQPVLFYWDLSYGLLRYGVYDGSQWFFSTIDGAGGTNGRITANVGPNVSAVIHNGVPEVYYYDQTNGNLRTGHISNREWVFSTMDGDGGPNNALNVPASDHVGIDVSATTLNGVPQLFYSWIPSAGQQTLTYTNWF